MENLPLERVILLSRKGSLPSFPVQMKRKCWDVGDLGRKEKEAHGPRSIQKRLKEAGQLCNHDFSWNDRKMLANEGPKGLPVDTPSICW